MTLKNLIEQTDCELGTTRLRMDSRAADNIRLKEVKKRRALRGKQRVQLLTNSAALTNSRVSCPEMGLHICKLKTRTDGKEIPSFASGHLTKLSISNIL